ncbi:hypothetical protein Ciccas_012214 [Cichlidogyrus casuarinus]|uniref:WW domain-containing protein n=1 Tax=Cichlidogyrus casuarinus TaxID=1844966 RepID=A0ABD2PP32_9PLAT
MGEINMVFQWEKNAIRVCGDWSEQLSSKGKIYFYNSVTEVSQWHKPPEWTLPDTSRHRSPQLDNGSKRQFGHQESEQYPKRPKHENGIRHSKASVDPVTHHISSSNKSPAVSHGKFSGCDEQNCSLSMVGDSSRLPPPPPPMPQVSANSRHLLPRSGQSTKTASRPPEKNGRTATISSTVRSITEFIKLLKSSERGSPSSAQPPPPPPDKNAKSNNEAVCRSYRDHRRQMEQGVPIKSDSSHGSPDRSHETEEIKNGPSPKIEPPQVSAERRNSDPRVRRMSSTETTENGKQSQLDSRLSLLQTTLESPQIRQYILPDLATRYKDTLAESLEKEACVELKNYDRLQSMLFSELACELKKLRALVLFSEIKLACHSKKYVRS